MLDLSWYLLIYLIKLDPYLTSNKVSEKIYWINQFDRQWIFWSDILNDIGLNLFDYFVLWEDMEYFTFIKDAIKTNDFFATDSPYSRRNNAKTRASWIRINTTSANHELYDTIAKIRQTTIKDTRFFIRNPLISNLVLDSLKLKKFLEIQGKS